MATPRPERVACDAAPIVVAGVGEVRAIGVDGALVGFAVMSGAVIFHLFTPLGIDPNNDGGGLFMAACVVWATTLALIIIRRNQLLGLVRDLGRAFVPQTAAPTPLRVAA